MCPRRRHAGLHITASNRFFFCSALILYVPLGAIRPQPTMSTSASSSTDAGSTKHPAGSPAKDYPKYSLSELTPSDPQAYLSLFKFSRKIICPRTNLPVSFADIGDESGVPLLWMMPSGGSRWFAAAHGELWLGSYRYLRFFVGVVNRDEGNGILSLDGRCMCWGAEGCVEDDGADSTLHYDSMPSLTGDLSRCPVLECPDSCVDRH